MPLLESLLLGKANYIYFSAAYKMNKYLGLHKLRYLREIVEFHGGWRSFFYKLWINDDLKIGRLAGTDKFGNKYYEHERFFFGRDRWVMYAPHVRLEYDASQICPEWFGWLHHKTDLLPHQDKSRPYYRWMLEDTENYTGTNCEFTPYSTTRPKITPWRPPKVHKKPKL